MTNFLNCRLQKYSNYRFTTKIFCFWDSSADSVFVLILKNSSINLWIRSDEKISLKISLFTSNNTQYIISNQTKKVFMKDVHFNNHFLLPLDVITIRYQSLRYLTSNSTLLFEYLSLSRLETLKCPHRNPSVCTFKTMTINISN